MITRLPLLRGSSAATPIILSFNKIVNERYVIHIRGFMSLGIELSSSGKSYRRKADIINQGELRVLEYEESKLSSSGKSYRRDTDIIN